MSGGIDWQGLQFKARVARPERRRYRAKSRLLIPDLDVFSRLEPCWGDRRKQVEVLAILTYQHVAQKL